MLVSHEVPLSLLNESRKFNDYDYCLLHLTYQYPQYKQFYIDSLKKGRKVLLDNSAYELGDALTNDQLANGVLDIKPTWYIIPDCLNDKDVTINRFENFIKDYKDLPGLKIGVVQGDNLKELKECYKYMSEKADKIAIPFASKGFECYFPLVDIDERHCCGRQMFIYELLRDGLWNKDKPHHLLGCSLAKEFLNLNYPLYIESIDTSNPIIAGMLDLTYEDKRGINHKPSIKMCDFMEYDFSESQLRLVKSNIIKFHKMVFDC